MSRKIFNEIIKHVSVSEIAAAFKISNAAVFQWRTKGIPSNRAATIEMMTSGNVTKEEMCPNFQWTS